MLLFNAKKASNQNVNNLSEIINQLINPIKQEAKKSNKVKNTNHVLKLENL